MLVTILTRGLTWHDDIAKNKLFSYSGHELRSTSLTPRRVNAIFYMFALKSSEVDTC